MKIPFKPIFLVALTIVAGALVGYFVWIVPPVFGSISKESVLSLCYG